MRNGIFGHTSFETAYHIADYPYGRTLRCERKVWLEHDPKHGYRFVAVTTNPKNGRWNKPHKSTYLETAACLYLDENGHVQWTGIGTYSEPEKVLAFVQDFGTKAEGFNALRGLCKQRHYTATQFATGRAAFAVNGVRQERTEAEKERSAKEAQAWLDIFNLMNSLLAAEPMPAEVAAVLGKDSTE